MREMKSTCLARIASAAQCICLAAALSIAMLPSRAFAAEQAAEPQTIVSSWAAEEIAQARELGLISQYFGADASNAYKTADFTAPITRRDFCTLAINYVELQNHFDGGRQFFDRMVEYYKYEKDSTNHHRNPFVDEGNFANAVDSYTAYYLGIALGDENHAFNGDNLLTRQEAAAILLRAYQTCGGELPQKTAEITFADGESIPDWARANACALSAWGVMKGDEKGNFNPTGQCSYEQAIVMFLRLYHEAPVTRAKGNVKPIFTYEQCMEWLNNWQSSAYRVSATAEGDAATFVRWDLGGVMHPVSELILVFRDGGIRLIRSIDYSASVENARFSQDGKTFFCTVTTADNGPFCQLTVDVDTMACETAEFGALSDMTGEQLAYLDLESAPEALRPQILRARLPIIYGKQGWTVDGLGSVQHADGTAEKLPEFSDLWPDWTVPFGPEWRKYGVMDPSDTGTSFYTTFLLGVSEKTGYWEFVLQNDGEAGCYFTIEGDDHTLVYTSEIIPAHARQQVLCAPDQPLAPGFYHVSVHSAQEGVSPKGTIWHYQYASYEMLTK